LKLLGYISNVKRCHLSGGETTPAPKANKIVVFIDFFRVGLCFPLHLIILEILEKYEVFLHQLTPNAIMRLGLFI